ncbi:MAG: sulfatase-like hydrolase/transferase [Clostridia bacterium]|nr:sulfatase-like hydrolase/transferase [Clostridia bacterium]
MQKRPNILFILSDDQGAWALGCAGNREIITPNIDALARDGVRFENFYCASPVCSPARASILTGEMPSCHGVQDWLSGGNVNTANHPYMKDHYKFRTPDVGIEYLAGHPSYIAELARSGYTCALSGKWHLGNQEEAKEGFSKWFTISSGGCHYYAPDFYENGEFTDCRDYVTDVITQRALDYLDELGKGPNPFCLQVHYTAPHSPWEAEEHPAEYLELYKDCPFESVPVEPIHKCQVSSAPVGDTPEKRRENLTGYYAAITAMDAGIGRLVEKLKRDGLYEDTIIIFTADNGMNMGHHGIWGKGNGTYPPNMFDTSVKVPFVIRLPRAEVRGIVAERSATHCDLYPTILEFAGAKVGLNDKQPGESLVPYLADGCPEGEERTVEIHDEYGFVRMLRRGRYKLVKNYLHGTSQLYDMVSDPEETQNRIADHALSAVVSELEGELEAWFERYSDPKCDGRKAVALTGSGQKDLCWKPDAFTDENYLYYTGTQPEPRKGEIK